MSKVHDVIRHGLWGTDGEGGPRGGASRELVTGNKYKSKDRNLGLTMRAERSRAAPVSRLSDHDQGGTGQAGIPFPKHTALPTPSWLNAWTDVCSLLCSGKSRRHPGLPHL